MWNISVYNEFVRVSLRLISYNFHRKYFFHFFFVKSLIMEFIGSIKFFKKIVKQLPISEWTEKSCAWICRICLIKRSGCSGSILIKWLCLIETSYFFCEFRCRLIHISFSELDRMSVFFGVFVFKMKYQYFTLAL